MTNYRHEYKYMLTAPEESILRIRAEGVLAKDPHAGADGSYRIHSLYFDDWKNSCMRENEDGTDGRSKFRIRYYNNDTSHLRLEKKSKHRGMTSKESCTLTEEECRSFLQGIIPTVRADMPPVKQKLFTQMRLRCLQPKIIVSYERIPYVYPGGNVRVTFDRNLSSSAEIGRFLDGTYPSRPILSPGQGILEVKWDEVLPGHIRTALAVENLQWTTFSKYYMCRIYHL